MKAEGGRNPFEWLGEALGRLARGGDRGPSPGEASDSMTDGFGPPMDASGPPTDESVPRSVAVRGAGWAPEGFYPLVSPPRSVPVLVRLSAVFGGFSSQFGWFFIGFGMIFVWVFGARVDVTSWYHFMGEVATAPGAVMACRETSYSENETPVYEHRYRFATPDGREHEGVCYATGRSVSEGKGVTVEYARGRPEVSRIEGMRRGMVGPMALMVFVFPTVGLVFVGVALRRGVKANRLLGRGLLALGTLKSKRGTRTRVNEQVVYELTFAFEAEDGETYEAVAKTHETARLTDEAEERILYDPVDPSYAVVMDALPGRPRIDETGNLRSASPVRSLLGLAAPLATLLGHGTYVYWAYVAC